MNQDIYVVIEHLRGQVAEISFVMLAGARELAKGFGGGLSLFCLVTKRKNWQEILRQDLENIWLQIKFSTLITRRWPISHQMPIKKP